MYKKDNLNVYFLKVENLNLMLTRLKELVYLKKEHIVKEIQRLYEKKNQSNQTSIPLKNDRLMVSIVIIKKYVYVMQRTGRFK